MTHTPDVLERVARAIFDSRLWAGAWVDANAVEKEASRRYAQAAITAYEQARLSAPAVTDVTVEEIRKRHEAAAADNKGIRGITNKIDGEIDYLEDWDTRNGWQAHEDRATLLTDNAALRTALEAVTAERDAALVRVKRLECVKP